MRCSKCGRDINAIGQDNMSYSNDYCLCEDCARLNNKEQEYDWTMVIQDENQRLKSAVDDIQQENTQLKMQIDELINRYEREFDNLTEMQKDWEIDKRKTDDENYKNYCSDVISDCKASRNVYRIVITDLSKLKERKVI